MVRGAWGDNGKPQFSCGSQEEIAHKEESASTTVNALFLAYALLSRYWLTSCGMCPCGADFRKRATTCVGLGEFPLCRRAAWPRCRAPPACILRQVGPHVRNGARVTVLGAWCKTRPTMASAMPGLRHVGRAGAPQIVQRPSRSRQRPYPRRPCSCLKPVAKPTSAAGLLAPRPLPRGGKDISRGRARQAGEDIEARGSDNGTTWPRLPFISEANPIPQTQDDRRERAALNHALGLRLGPDRGASASRQPDSSAGPVANKI